MKSLIARMSKQRLGLLVLTVCAICFAGPVTAELAVSGSDADKAAFEKLLKDLVEGAAVKIEGGKVKVEGTPSNEFGKNLKTITDDASNKVTVKVGRNQDGVIVGAFHGGGVQEIDLDDIEKFPGPGSMLPTKAAQLKHELDEVYNSVKDGKMKATPGKTDPSQTKSDFQINHEGSAKTGEDAVNKEEAGITRKGESKALPEKNGVLKVKEVYEKGDKTIDVEWNVTRDGKKFQVDSVKMEGAPAPKGGRLVVEEEPGIRLFDDAFAPKDFLSLGKPGYLEIDPFGKVYVSEQALNKVLVFDSTMDASGTLKLSKQFEISDPAMNNPQGIAVAALQERLFVGSGDNILAFDLAGSFLTSFSAPELHSVRGLEVDREGLLYASSFDNDLILKFDPTTGDVISMFGNSLLDGPEGIAIDQLGNLWVSSFLNDSILQFDLGGNYLGTLASGGMLDGPKGLGLTPQGFLVPGLLPGTIGNIPETLLVSSYNNDRVLEYDLQSGLVVNSAFAKTPVGVGQLTLEPVPEPSTLALVGIAALGLIGFRGKSARTRFNFRRTAVVSAG